MRAWVRAWVRGEGREGRGAWGVGREQVEHGARERTEENGRAGGHFFLWLQQRRCARTVPPRPSVPLSLLSRSPHSPLPPRAALPRVRCTGAGVWSVSCALLRCSRSCLFDLLLRTRELGPRSRTAFCTETRLRTRIPVARAHAQRQQPWYDRRAARARPSTGTTG